VLASVANERIVQWYRDRVLWTAIGVAFLLRALPLWAWMKDGCLRDECTYLKLSHRFVDGQGITTSAGWLWAPGYPWLLSLHERFTGHAGAMKISQVAVSLLCIVLIYTLTQRVFSSSEDPRRRARITAWLYALSPHLAFFSIRLWSEVVYGTILVGVLLVLQSARESWDDTSPPKWLGQVSLTVFLALYALVSGAPLWAAIAVGGALYLVVRSEKILSLMSTGILWAGAVGVLAGICVLFRGVATYMLPILVLGVLWGRWRQSRAWLQACTLVSCAVLIVAPYSVHATEKFGDTVISDRTMGQMMWLGNNDFDPITFDYGNGQLSRRAFKRTTETGRKPCADRKEAISRDECQAQAGFDWMKSNQLEFAKRMPERVAQLVNPHSLLTRHLRWGRWKGLPQWADEIIILVGALSSMLVMVGGAVGLAVRGRGGTGLVFSGILLYHVAAIAALAGLSRYRVPLEPLLMIYAAGLLADWRGSLQVLRECRWRRWVTGIGLLLFVPLVLWNLPAGWPWWRSW
jgi:4-amino-4-deoxy-L-arabinose transferase-like glycosyltransferase